MKRSVFILMLGAAMTFSVPEISAQNAAFTRPWSSQGNSQVQQGICMPLVVEVCKRTASQFGVSQGTLLREYTDAKTSVECLSVSAAGIGEFRIRREDGTEATCHIEGL